MKIFLYLLIFSIFQFSAKAQDKAIEYDTKIIYQFTYQSDSTSEGSRKSIFTQLMTAAGESHFQTISKFESDSALSSNEGGWGAIFYSYGRIEPNNFIIIKNDDAIYTYEPVNGVGFSGNNEISYYQEKKSDLQWEIHPDTIHKYSFICQKATTNWGGRKWTAWFTSDLPISDGPYKFCGLPGLIIAISDEDRYFTFDVVSIGEVKSMSLSFDKIRQDLALLKTTKEVFYKDRKKIRNDMAGYAILTGSRFTEEINRKIILEAKLDNNFIERY